MRLEDLIKGIYHNELSLPFRQREIQSISCDSRDVTTNTLFVALKGQKFNGVDFIPDAIKQGATVIASDRNDGQNSTDPNVCFLDIDDTSAFLKEIACRFFGNPSKKCKTIGITGTNGKTTISYLLESVLNEANKSCGIIGTINHRIGGRTFPSVNTTPSFLDNQKFLSCLTDKSIEYCIMEVSSHALDQGRVDGISFAGAIFSNCTSDHLDYHKSQSAYFDAKAKLFEKLSSDSHAVINIDDPYAEDLIVRTKAHIMTYGVKMEARVRANDIQFGLDGTQLTVIFPNGQCAIKTKLIGYYNVYNILSVVAMCLTQGIAIDDIQRALEHFSYVPGRLERIDCGQDYSIFLDYAHTEDALENVLKTLKEIAKKKIICVFGCGGDRDQSKRPKMAEIASRLADMTIVTTDNPRNENPEEIIDQIIEGFHRDNYEAIVDRKEAIQKALDSASKDDIVLIAGKGHETYQIVKDQKIDFNERKIVEQYLTC